MKVMDKEFAFKLFKNQIIYDQDDTVLAREWKCDVRTVKRWRAEFDNENSGPTERELVKENKNLKETTRLQANTIGTQQNRIEMLEDELLKYTQPQWLLRAVADRES